MNCPFRDRVTEICNKLKVDMPECVDTTCANCQKLLDMFGVYGNDGR